MLIFRVYVLIYFSIFNLICQWRNFQERFFWPILKSRSKVYPILYSFGKINIYSHGLMIVLGMILGAYILFRLVKKEGLPSQIFWEIVIFSIYGGMIGARLLYIILYFNQFNTWLDVLAFWDGGMVSFGGMIGGILATFFVLKIHKLNFYKWLDIAIAPLFIGWGIGRIGCFLNGDSTGIVTSSSFAIWGRYPTALWESVLLIIISVLSFSVYRKKKNVWPQGFIFVLAIALYGTGRFFIDFVKDEPYWFWHLHFGQIGSLFAIFVAFIIYRLIMERVAVRLKN
jgi:phosphatidylglycerol:prolipoprotein diacylglycerol transferase